MHAQDNDPLTPVAQAIDAWPDLFGQRRPHVRTLKNWFYKGVNGVYLELRFVGQTACVRRSSLETFFTDLAKAKKKGAA